MSAYECKIIDDVTIKVRAGTRGSLTFSVGGPVAGLAIQDLCNTINDMQAELSALRAQAGRCDEWRNALQGLTPMGSEFTEPQECADWLRDHLNYPKQIVELRARCAALEEALQPFVVYLQERVAEELNDEFVVTRNWTNRVITVGDLRKAAAALHPATKSAGKEA